MIRATTICRLLGLALVAGLLAACMPPAPPDQPRRLVDPGEFYWAQLECVAGAQLAVTAPGGANNLNALNGFDEMGQWGGAVAMQQDFRTTTSAYRERQQLEAMQQQYVEDCIRTRGYGWYMDRMRNLHDWLQYIQ
ncbi:hypothetical protein CKO15_03800 [Halorhodospira abdelmalekii]|nr:hypothetical protein [Halorhodospira abdelmalekii]